MRALNLLTLAVGIVSWSTIGHAQEIRHLHIDGKRGTVDADFDSGKSAAKEAEGNTQPSLITPPTTTEAKPAPTEADPEMVKPDSSDPPMGTVKHVAVPAADRPGPNTLKMRGPEPMDTEDAGDDFSDDEEDESLSCGHCDDE